MAVVQEKESRALAGAGRGLVPVGLIGSAATIVWLTLAVLLSGRGLGKGNEGYYLLSYTYWDRNPRTFSGTQYLYGPVFELLGNDISSLRILRALLVLVVHIAFAVSFMRWLRLQRPHAPSSRSWEYAGASLIVASAVVIYGWLPPTPGYNDVTLLGSLVLTTTVLVALHRVATGRTVPLWVGVAFGLTAGAMLLAKPPSAVAIAFIALVGAPALRRAGGRTTARLVAGAAAGLVAFAALIQVLVKPWSEILPPMRDTLEVVATKSHPPLNTLGSYLGSILTIVLLAAVIAVPAIGFALYLWRRPERAPGRAAVPGLLTLAGSVTFAVSVGGIRAADDNVAAYASGIVGMGLVVLTFTLVTRAPADVPRSRAVALLLVAVPAVQGFGTNNAIYAVAVNGAAFWVALMVMGVTRQPASRNSGYVVPAAAAGVAAMLCVVVGIDGLTHDPARHSLLGDVTTASDVPALAGLRLPPPVAVRYSSMRRDLRPYLVGREPPMLAFGELSQYVFVLGGRPIGQSWYTGYDDGLNSADLRAACADGNPWGDRQPLVVTGRELTSAELHAWRTCGVDFETEYRDVTPSATPPGVHILVNATR